MNIKRVAMLLSNPYKPDPRVQKEARSLVDSGYSVSLHCWDRQGEYPSNENRDGMEISRVVGRSGYGAGSRQILHIPIFWLSAIEQVRKYKPDIIHCHDLDTVPVGYWYGRSRCVPWIYDAHECYPEQIRLQVNPFIYRLLLYIERFITPRATRVITVGERLAYRFRSLGGKVSIVGNYPILNENNSVKKISRFDVGCNSKDFIVAYIGGFTLAREIIPLIDAVQNYPEVTILLIGDGPQRAAIEAKLPTHPNVHYLGRIPHEEVPGYTVLADVIYYGLNNNDGNSYYSAPNALFNAMAAGKPVITTNVGEIAQIVKQEQCGVVIERAEPTLIAQAMKRLDDPANRQLMEANALRAAQNKYNWNFAKESLLKVYRQIILPS